MLIPDSKKRIIDAASAEVDNIESQYRDGIITRTEKYNKVVDVWTKATQDVSAEMNKEISTDILTDPKTGKQEANLSFNPIFMMSNSGRPRQRRPDAPARRHARPYGQALRRNHRNPDHRELP